MIIKLITLWTLTPLLTFASLSESEKGALLEKWTEGYLYDFREYIRTIEGRHPMIVTTLDHSKKKTKSIEVLVEDRDLIEEIVKMIVDDVEKTTKEENWIDENGSMQGRRTLRTHASPNLKLSWNIEGLLVGFRFDVNGVECFHKFDSKNAQVLYLKRSCSEDLGSRVKDMLQPVASDNEGQSPRLPKPARQPQPRN